MNNTIAIVPARSGNWKNILQLLSERNLMTSDLTAERDFLVAIQDDELVGCGCLERHDSWGFVRSVAVASPWERCGIGRRLVNKLILRAKAENLRGLYLLTLDAQHFFRSVGFAEVARQSVPEAIQQTDQFITSCPQSATVMFYGLE